MSHLLLGVVIEIICSFCCFLAAPVCLSVVLVAAAAMVVVVVAPATVLLPVRLARPIGPAGFGSLLESLRPRPGAWWWLSCASKLNRARSGYVSLRPESEFAFQLESRVDNNATSRWRPAWRLTIWRAKAKAKWLSLSLVRISCAAAALAARPRGLGSAPPTTQPAGRAWGYACPWLVCVSPIWLAPAGPLVEFQPAAGSAANSSSFRPLADLTKLFCLR